MRSASLQKKSKSYASLREAIGSDGLGEFYQGIMGAVYNALLSPGATALDCGAHVGRHTIPMAEVVGPAGHVHAFEPVPESLVELRKALERAGIGEEVTIHEVALGNDKGPTPFTVAHGALGRSGVQQRILPPTLAEKVTVEQITVEMRRLDDMTSKFGDVTFAKLNLQGGEFDALKGGEQFLQRARPVLAIENGREESAQLYGYTAEEFFGFIDSISYRICDCVGFGLDQSDWTVGGQPWIHFLVPSERTDLDAVVQRIIDRELRAKKVLSFVA